MTTRDGLLPENIRGLLDASAYPHAVSRIEVLQTLISWVFLTGEFAYKVKKPVNLGFLDFRTLEQRRHCCNEELRLNRNWAPQLYLDVVPIVQSGGGTKIGVDGKVVDYAVKMRQFDQSMRLDHQIESGRLSQDDVRLLAAEVARRHMNADRVPASREILDATRRLIWENFEQLRAHAPNRILNRISGWMRARLKEHEARFVARCAAGFFRECHGDLHLGNLARLPEGIRAFDCIEFSRELCEIDVVADYAFLTMDFIARGRADLACIFVNRYLETTGDYDGACLLPPYLVYRSMVRAKVAALASETSCSRTDDAEIRHSVRRYSALARGITVLRQPVLVQLTGFAGSGKTWLSSGLLTVMPAVRLRSDIERKRLFGLDEAAQSGSGIDAGIYDRKADAAVYDHLLNKAADLLYSGIDVILDASFLDVGGRVRARDTAARCGAAGVTIQVVASSNTLRERVQRRAVVGDASEAGVDVLRHQFETAEPLGADELKSALIVDTDENIDVTAIVSGIRRLAGLPK